MAQQSDDESSDSSNEFLVSADKIDLNSTFFKEPVIKKPNSKKTPVIQSNSEDSDSDFDYSNDENVNSAELLSQVLKNLENAKNQSFGAQTSQAEPSTSKEPASDAKGDDLSKEISNLLMQGESSSTLANEGSQDEKETEDTKAEVKSEYEIPQKGIQIHLPGENVMFDRKKKKQQDLQKMLQSKLNSAIRSNQVYVHKIGLLCWLSHGFFLNKLTNEPELLAIALSLVSSTNYPKGRPDLTYMEKFTKWFTGRFKIVELQKEVIFSKELLLQRFLDKNISNYIELILLYIATVRGMGINCRLVISLRPPPLKPLPEQLFKMPNEESDTKSKKTKTENVEQKSTKQRKNTKENSVKNHSGKGKNKSKERLVSPTKIIPENSRDATKTASEEAKKKAAIILKEQLNSANKKIGNSKKNRKDNCESDKEKVDQSSMTIAKKLRLRTNNMKNKSDTKTSSKANKSSIKRKHESSSDTEFSGDDSDFSSDEEYVEKKPKQRVKQVNQKQTVAGKSTTQSNKQRKLLSSEEEDQKTVKNTFNVWVEVFVESEESWISVDVLNQKIHCVSDLFKNAGNPVLYIVAWNSAGSIKDVTRRYCPHWLTDTRKKRVDEKWWSETLSAWKEKKTAMSRAEDEQLLQRELEQPLPKTVGECKGHPLYVLTRHLLKFEGLYPPDAVPLGHLKTGEAIYSRHCVHTLMSRETWVKKARVVKPAQEAYKIVKSMPKYDKLSGMRIKDQPLELFGKWQTNPYEPPVAKDGKVPRNEYGNVDLFKMCMLPVGCVYINLPALNRVARKLNIDCAPACVGFNFGCRGALPAFEGFVVCTEFEDTLREAWETEQIEAQKRAKERREKRIYGNWKKLIKGLMIREKLAAKYNFGDEDDNENGETKELKAALPKAVTTKKVPTRKVVKQTFKRILKEESSEDEEKETEIQEKKPTRSTRKVTAKTMRDEESDSGEESEVEITEKKSIFKKINAAAIITKKAAEKDKRADITISGKRKKNKNDDDKDIAEMRPKRVAKKEATATKETIETDESIDEEEVKPVIIEKKSIFKKINAAAIIAKKAAEKEDKKKENVIVSEKPTIAQKLKALSAKSANKTSERKVQDNTIDQEEGKSSTAVHKSLRSKNTEVSKKVSANIKETSEDENITEEDEDLKEFAHKSKKAAAPKKVTVTASKVSTRASKRNKQESKVAAKKVKR